MDGSCTPPSCRRAYALNAATGELIWRFEPAVDYRVARGGCCDLVNRGVAVWKGKVYVAAFDGVLYALDAADGTIEWQVQTIEDTQRAYTSTGAPQVAGNVVIIGMRIRIRFARLCHGV